MNFVKLSVTVILKKYYDAKAIDYEYILFVKVSIQKYDVETDYNSNKRSIFQ